MGFEKIGKPNKVQTVPKSPNATMQSRTSAYTGKSNKTKAWQPMKVTMKGRMK